MATDISKDIVNRLRSIQGHARAIERMVEEDAYCVDVLRQTLAVRRALEKVDALVLDRHLNRCVTRMIRSGTAEERQRVMDEVLELFEAKARV